MAQNWRIIRHGGNLGAFVAELVADHVSDVSTLPVSPEMGTGSKCQIIEDSSIWQLGVDNEWHEVEYAGGGGGIDVDWGFF